MIVPEVYKVDDLTPLDSLPEAAHKIVNAFYSERFLWDYFSWLPKREVVSDEWVIESFKNPNLSHDERTRIGMTREHMRDKVSEHAAHVMIMRNMFIPISTFIQMLSHNANDDDDEEYINMGHATTEHYIKYALSNPLKRLIEAVHYELYKGR